MRKPTSIVTLPFPRFRLQTRMMPVIAGALLAAAVLPARAETPPDSAPPATERGVKTVSPEVANAVDALKQGEPARAAAFLRTAAENGDPAAQALLGQLYADGNGVERDLFEAGRWLRAAAANGEPTGAYALATLTDDGTLTPPGMDPANREARDNEATRLYLAAANHGSVPGQIETGLRYVRGVGTAQNLTEAARWFSEAADAGSPDAQFNLGALHASGALNDGTPDHATARTWFTRAAELGHADAQYNLGLIAAQGLGGPVDNAVAAKWFKRAADQGVADAQSGLAYLTYQGLGVRKDEAKAAELYAKAADQGHLVAQNRLARLYVMGRGVEADMAEAWKWHSLSTRAGFEDKELDARFAKHLTPDDHATGDARAAQWLDGRAAR